MEESPGADSDLFLALAEDEKLEPLLHEQFDAKAFAAATIQCQIVGETLKKLANGIAELDAELYTQVVSNYEDLLSQATGLEALESVLKMMQTRIYSLQAAVDRICSKIVDPYHKILTRTTQLARLQAACDLLRKVIRMFYLIKRLRTQVAGGNREFTKVAQTFSEIDQLEEGSDLTGIKVLEDEKPFLLRARKEVESQAKKMLMQGMELMNPTQVGMALQVFHNLRQLPSTLLLVLSSYREAVQRDVQNSLDPASLMQSTGSFGPGRSTLPTPGRSTLPTPGSSASWKASLWTRLDKLVSSTNKTLGQIQQLHIVLVKKKDPLSQVSFLELISETEACGVLVNFWKEVTEILSVELATAAKASTFLKQAFESDYPKLVRLFSQLLTQAQTLTGTTATDSKSRRLHPVPPSPSFLPPPPPHPSPSKEQRQNSPVHEEDLLLCALSQFEKPYISRSLNRLFEAVNQLFLSSANGSLPSIDDMGNLVQTVTSELNAAGGNATLTSVVAKSVEKTIQLFNMKCEQMLVTGKESFQVCGPPNAAQIRNISTVNSLHAFNKTITDNILSLSSLPDAASAIIQRGLEGTVNQMTGTISLFNNGVLKALEQMIYSMHSEDFSGVLGGGASVLDEAEAGESPCSGYMREMQSFTARIHTQFYSRYHCKEAVLKQLEGIAVRVVELFVRHVCLVRPLEEAGKMRLTIDMAQLEMVLTPFVHKFSELGRPYKMLRCMKRLLFLAPEHLLSESIGVGVTLPTSCALNFLFSRAPSEMKSPHQVQKWSEEEYSEWMDRHPLEEDRLKFIKATLDTYSRRVKSSKGQLQLATVYSTMMKLVLKATET